MEGKSVLVCGGNGYIGSHTVLALLESGSSKVVIADNLDNSSKDVLPRLQELAGDKADRIVFVEERSARARPHKRSCTRVSFCCD